MGGSRGATTQNVPTLLFELTQVISASQMQAVITSECYFDRYWFSETFRHVVRVIMKIFEMAVLQSLLTSTDTSGVSIGLSIAIDSSSSTLSVVHLLASDRCYLLNNIWFSWSSENSLNLTYLLNVQISVFAAECFWSCQLTICVFLHKSYCFLTHQTLSKLQSLVFLVIWRF